MRKVHLTLCFLLLLSAGMMKNTASAQVITTDYTWDECRGSARPYPKEVVFATAPDSLRAIMINHVGRHGARYPASGVHADEVRSLLLKAKEKRTITPRGSKLLALTERIITASSGRWGVLDTLGKAEQQGIAMRMYSTFPKLFKNGRINAISSYVPRCIMSMYEFTHQIARLDDRVEIYTQSGHETSRLMRFFKENKMYESFAKSDEVKNAISAYADTVMPVIVLRKLLGAGFPLDDINKEETLMAIYSVIAGTAAMEMRCNPADYLTIEEMNRLWSVFNLKQYLTHSASAMSMLPAQASAPLLINMIATTDSLLAGCDIAPVQLRFGHAETLMPLLALMRVPGCVYETEDMADVVTGWKDFDIVPMAANFRFVLFRSRTGRIYVRADLNAIPVAMLPSRPGELYVPWDDMRSYLKLRLSFMM